MSLLLVALLLALIWFVTARAIVSAQAVTRQEARVVALNAAEAGIAEAVERLRQDAWSSSFSGELPRATYSVTFNHGLDAGPWRTVVIESTGKCPAQRLSQRVRAMVAVSQDLSSSEPPMVRLVEWTLVP